MHTAMKLHCTKKKCLISVQTDNGRRVNTGVIENGMAPYPHNAKQLFFQIVARLRIHFDCYRGSYVNITVPVEKVKISINYSLHKSQTFR